MQSESSPDPLREKCSGIEERLALYVLDDGICDADRGIENDERGRIEEHVAGCDACRQDVDVLRATTALVREAAASDERLDETRRSRLLTVAGEASHEDRVVRRPSSFASRVALLGSAAAVIVAALVWARWQLTTQEASPDSGIPGVTRSAPDSSSVELQVALGADDRLQVASGGATEQGWSLGKTKVAASLPSNADLAQTSRLTSTAAPVPGENRPPEGSSSPRFFFSETTVHAKGGSKRPRGDDVVVLFESHLDPSGPGGGPPTDAPLSQLLAVAAGNTAGRDPAAEVPQGLSRENVASPGLGGSRYRKSYDSPGGLFLLPPAAGGRAVGGANGGWGAVWAPGTAADEADGGEAEKGEAEQSGTDGGPENDASPLTLDAVAGTEKPASKRERVTTTAASDPADPAEMRLDDGGRPSPAPGSDRQGEPAAQKTPGGPTIAQRIDTFLSQLDRRPGESPSAMFYRYWGDNSFVETATSALSTFAIDVDTASYTLTRKHLYDRGVLPPPKAVRTEELVNYFPAGYEPPEEGEGAFAIHTEIAPSPFAHEPQYKLLRVGIKAREVKREQRKACSIVFVVDTSGSMRQGGRLELVKDALGLLVDELDEGDRIGIVAFDSTSRVILEPVPGSRKELVVDAINTLVPAHSTNLDAGMTLGYRMAESAFRETASNRVILLSDGVANTGATDQVTILSNVSSQRAKGIYLTTVGVGMDNHNDALLEQLADRGNGSCVYVDRIEEARKVFVENLTGTLETVARDAKIQVEFNDDEVLRYRRLGYENRVLADRDFRDDTVDAGEAGAGQEVTALYEIKLRRPDDKAGVTGRVDPLATVRVRYLTVEHGEAVEVEKKIEHGSLRDSFDDATPGFQLATYVAEFAEILRDSYWARGSDLTRVADGVETLLSSGKITPSDDVTELVALMKHADALVEQRQAARNDVAMVVDALKENRHLRAQIQEVRGRGVEDTRRYLEELRTQNGELRRRLEELLTP